MFCVSTNWQRQNSVQAVLPLIFDTIHRKKGSISLLYQLMKDQGGKLPE